MSTKWSASEKLVVRLMALMAIVPTLTFAFNPLVSVTMKWIMLPIGAMLIAGSLVASFRH